MKRTTKRDMAEELEKCREHARRIEQRMARIVDITSGIIYILDSDGYFTFVNKAVEEILHFRPEELIGKHFSFIMEEEEFRRVGRKWALPPIAGTNVEADRAPKLFDERRTGERRTRDLEVRLLTRERRQERILVGDVTGIVGGEGAYDHAAAQQQGESCSAGFVGSQGIIFDITRYKRAEDERRALFRVMMECRRVEAVERLAGGIADALNSKIGAALGYAELLENEGETEETSRARYVESILRSVRGMADLTERLLGAVRHDVGRMEEVELNALVRRTAHLIETVAESGVKVRVCAGSEPVVVRGDFQLIRNALLNLALCSLDSMRGEGRLEFGVDIVTIDRGYLSRHCAWAEPGLYARLRVADSGKGRTDAPRPSVFEQLPAVQRDAAESVLGLSNVGGCARNHGGFVVVESGQRKGTTVDLFLSLAEEQ